MKPRSKKAFVLLVIVSGILVVVAAGFALKRPLLERWYIWQLESQDEEETKRAAERLGAMRSVRAVPLLVQMFERQPVIDRSRHYTLKALVRIGAPAVPALIEVFDKNKNVKAPSAHPGQRQNWKGAIRGIVALVAEALEEIGPPARSAAAALLDISNNCGFTADCSVRDNYYCGYCIWSRHAAAEALPRIASVSDLTQRVQDKDENPLVRKAAVIALGMMEHSGRAGIPVLVEALKNDEHEHVRARAAEALRKIDSEGRVAVSALRLALRDKSEYVRGVAEISLERMGAVPAATDEEDETRR